MDIAAWLRELGLERYQAAFRDNDIDLAVLPELTADDLIGLGVTSIGHRRKIFAAIARLDDTHPIAAGTPPPVAAPERPRHGATGRADAERRQLTVLFCDLVGSTKLSRQLDPEELREVMRGYQDTASGIITRFDGHVAKFMGDGVLAYFGWPRAHEDDAERAVRAGLALSEAVGELQAPEEEPLAVRIGIATGRVVVGDLIGTGAAQEEAVVGETPNLAARLQELARPAGVVIASSTRRLLGGLFELQALGDRRLKGFAQPVPTFRVVRESASESRFEALHGRQPTAMVGREHELGLLLERWERAKEGEGQVVLLCGEPGIGKSRVAQSLRQRLVAEPHTRLSYDCSPHHTNSALYPVIRQLERAAGLRPDDSADCKLDKLKSVLVPEPARDGEVVALLATLLAIPAGGRYLTASLTPEMQKARTFEALVEQLVGLARQQPVLMVFEDAHWIDPTSAELFGLVIDRIQRLPVLLLITFRPEFTPPWTGHAHITSLTLNRLGRSHGAAMVLRVAGGKNLPRELLDQVLAKTDGVPLFVEELTKAILESRQLIDAGDHYDLAGPLPSLAIPATVQDLLMARLDRLATVKEVAQVGATIGREFSHELLAAATPLGDSQLRDALVQLVDSELVFRRGTPPAATYVFKHALVQDAAYQSLLKSRRQQLHARIAEVLEARCEGAQRESEHLARHYREAGLLEKAIPYAIQAGDEASGGFAFVEARARHHEALEMARALPPSEQASRLQIRAVLKLANVASNHQQFKYDLANLERVLTLAQQLNNQPRLGQIYYWMARIHYVLGQFDRAVELAETALRITEGLRDDKATAAPVNLLARLYHARGHPRRANPLAARSVRQMHALGDTVEKAGISGILGLTYAILGQLPQALEAIQEGIEIAETISHRPTLAACLFYRGTVRGWWRDLERALPDFEQALSISVDLGDLFRTYSIHGWRGQAYLLAGDHHAAEADLRQSLVLAERIGTTYCIGSFKAYLAEVRLAAGDVAEATELCRQALPVASETRQLWSLGIACRAFARCLLATDPSDTRGAENAIREALRTQEENGARIERAWSLPVLAEVLREIGDESGATREFDRAAAAFDDMGMIAHLATAQTAHEAPRRRP